MLWILLLRRLLLPVAALLVVVPAAHAADPIMPLSEVRQGMKCSGLSVIKGTTVSSFDVEILDVIAPETGLSGPRILVRVSGPAVDETGIGPGFSGSPVICDGRNAGAISEGLGEYGNHVALATPIEEMLQDRPTPPATARRDRELLRAARPLQTPLTVSGLTGRAGALLERAARRARRPLLVAPAGPIGGYAPVDLRAGSALSAAISTGDLGLSAVGTVTYRDGDDIWAFGHPLDGLGRRALFLTDAYIYTVIQNPLGIPDFGAVTYKLASTDGHLLGSVTSDTVDSVAGTVGAEPPSIPLRIDARNRAGERVTVDSLLADERSLGYGAGLSFVAPLGVAQALGRLMRDFGPVTFRMCARFRVRELRRPMRFCNTYFSVDDAVSHLTEAGAMIDFFDLAPLHVQRAGVSLRARPGVKQDVLIGARGPRRAHRGQRIRVRLTLQRRRGARHGLTVPVRIPRSLRPGVHTLTLRGSGNGFSEEALVEELIVMLEGEFGGGGGRSEPRTVRELARRIRSFRQRVGIEARFRHRRPQLVHRSREVSYEGRVRLRLRVTRRARR